MSTTSVSPKNERRRYPRIEILGRVQGVVRPLNDQISLLNLSVGGCLMQTSAEYSVGQTHEFQLTAPDFEPIVVRGRIAHVMRVTVEHRPMFLYGLEFAEVPRHGDHSIEALINLLSGKA